MLRRRTNEQENAFARTRVARFPGSNRVMRVAYLTGGVVCLAALIIALSLYVLQLDFTWYFQHQMELSVEVILAVYSSFTGNITQTVIWF